MVMLKLLVTVLLIYVAQSTAVDGGYTAWSPFDSCTKSCGGGTQKRSFFHSIAHILFGNGGYTAWSPYGSCSKPCGGGLQTRSRSCISRKACFGSSTDKRKCNTHKCPINGGYTAWSRYGSCSKPCGGGLQTRSRSCTNPTPQHGGKACSGSSTDKRKCNTHKCPIDGVLTSWSSYGSCSKTCGVGYKIRTRTCKGPFYGGKGCVGILKQTQSCGTEICLIKSDLTNRIKNLMRSYQSQSHSTFRYTLKNSLSSTYPSYYFTVVVYNPCSGWDTHTVRGYSYVSIFRLHNRNVVVTYTKKSSSFPSSSKRAEIKSAVINAITKKGRSARTSNTLAWNKATSYGYRIASIHVVRFGNGLRGALGSYADFQNFVCDRSCNWLGRCTNHESSIIIVYGSA